MFFLFILFHCFLYSIKNCATWTQLCNKTQKGLEWSRFPVLVPSPLAHQMYYCSVYLTVQFIFIKICDTLTQPCNQTEKGLPWSRSLFLVSGPLAHHIFYSSFYFTVYFILSKVLLIGYRYVTRHKSVAWYRFSVLVPAPLAPQMF